MFGSIAKHIPSESVRRPDDGSFKGQFGLWMGITGPNAVYPGLIRVLRTNQGSAPAYLVRDLPGAPFKIVGR